MLKVCLKMSTTIIATWVHQCDDNDEDSSEERFPTLISSTTRRDHWGCGSDSTAVNCLYYQGLQTRDLLLLVGLRVEETLEEE